MCRSFAIGFPKVSQSGFHLWSAPHHFAKYLQVSHLLTGTAALLFIAWLTLTFHGFKWNISSVKSLLIMPCYFKESCAFSLKHAFILAYLVSIIVYRSDKCLRVYRYPKYSDYYVENTQKILYCTVLMS